jgi:hypothetical protein
VGADSRLFQMIDVGLQPVKHLEWIEPLPKETLNDYAKRLCEQVDTSSPFVLMGVSIGGMLVVEMNKFIKPEQSIIISSIKGRQEMPPYYTFFRITRIYRLFPATFIRRIPIIIKPFFGRMNKGEYKIYVDMLRNTSAQFINWAEWALLNWDNTEIPENLTHIHGTRDVIFPIRYITNCIPIAGGQHYMIVRKSREINKILKTKLHYLAK